MSLLLNSLETRPTCDIAEAKSEPVRNGNADVIRQEDKTKEFAPSMSV